MIEIPEPPSQRACASCANPLSWLWSFERQAWICIVRTGPVSLDLHTCKHAQDPPTWRDLPTGDPPSGEYLEARSKIAPRGYDG